MMKRVVLATCVTVALLVGPAAVYGQQTAPSAITGDVTLGFASGSGGEYKERTQYVWHLAVDARVAQAGRTDFLVGVAGDVSQHPGDFLALCSLGSHGQCVPSSPVLRGASLDLSARAHIGEGIALTGGVGGGLYGATDPMNGAGYGTSAVWILKADAAVRMTRHLGFVIAGRRLMGVQAAGASLGLNCLTVGIRGR
jgi:hypothetical protein